MKLFLDSGTFKYRSQTFPIVFVLLIYGSDLGNTVTVKTHNIQNGRSSDKYGNLCTPLSIFICFLNPYTIFIL